MAVLEHLNWTCHQMTFRMARAWPGLDRYVGRIADVAQTHEGGQSASTPDIWRKRDMVLGWDPAILPTGKQKQ